MTIIPSAPGATTANALYKRSAVTSGSDSSRAALAGVDKAFNDLIGKSDSPEDMLKDITAKGVDSLWKWQIKKLKEKIAAQVMQEMNLSPAQIAAMPAEQRMSIEQKILEEVERRVKQLVEQGLQKKNPDSFGAVKLDSPTLQSLIRTAQEITA